MLGTYRFFLASLVALSHFKGIHFPLNVGVCAVVCFYMISGYLMAGSFARFAARSPHPARDFYRDRFLRLYPLFFLVFVLSVAWMKIDAGQPQIPFKQLWPEALIVPANYYFVLGKFNHMIPPDWSLATEIQYYLLVPLLHRLSFAAKRNLLLMLALGQLICLHLGHPLHGVLAGQTISDLFAYRSPPFIFAPFLLGQIFYEERQKHDYLVTRVTIGLYAFALLFVFANHALQYSMAGEMLFSMVLFVPLGLTALNIPSDVCDRVLGSLSYPLFLVHFLAAHVVHFITGRDVIAANYCLSLFLAFLLSRVQEMIDRRRHEMRGVR